MIEEDGNLYSNIFVVGNGPSVAEIDFRRLPKDIKYFRMTNFFFEDKYYAGKKVDYYIEYVLRLENQYFNLHQLNERGEYLVDKNKIYITVTGPKEYFPTIIPATPLIQQNKAIAEFRAFYQFYYGQFLSTGITAIALAMVLGFKNIYLAGFDMFSNPVRAHLYDDGKMEKLLRQEIYNNKLDNNVGGGQKTKYNNDSATVESILKNHPTDMQIKFLNLLKTEFRDARLYSVCELSPINQYVDLAPVIYDAAWYLPEDKAADATRDWLPLPVKQ
jgi:alpha-2,3 sialyltransferase